MGSLCPRGDPEADNRKLQGEDSLKEGPVTKRGCTDIICLPIFAFAQVVFVIVTIAGLSAGDPSKLYKPRDFKGDYCGVKENWNNGGDFEGQAKLSYTMNLTATVDTIMKQTVCSTAAASALTEGSNPILANETARQQYLCSCCLMPCVSCDGSLDVGGDLKGEGDVSTVIGGRMSALTDVSGSGSGLFDPSGTNGDMFSATSFWEEATKYFNMVCLPDCDTSFRSMKALNASGAARAYTYAPDRDDPLYTAWQELVNSDVTPSGIKTTIQNSFTFKALPHSTCPYKEKYCVPFPGMEFSELYEGVDYCQFEMAAEVADAVGGSAAKAFENLGGAAFSESATYSFGEWAGDFQQTMDTFVLVAFLSFVVGLVFLVLLRYFLGVCVWIAIGVTVFFFALGGGAVLVRSGQCAAADFFSSGQQTAVAVTAAGAQAAQDTVTGTEPVSEAMTGDGADYQGLQRFTKTGKSCQHWSQQDVLSAYTPAAYPQANLTKNYCRNPYKEGDSTRAKTIWCVTSDTDTKWEECLPIGVIFPDCDGGYAVKSEAARHALFYASFVIWGLGVLWMILIVCLMSRIRLAIALNQVAAQFLSHHPSSLLLPVVQSAAGVAWCLAWMISASFLLSQVPDGAVPKVAYTSFAEAFGTAASCAFWETGDECTGTPGKCTDKWPTGGVWKECGEGAAADECWRCSPPRYALDLRFAISFFVFLWNNAFIVALGQIMIAMAVSLWFFTKEKGKVGVVWRGVKTVFRYHLGTVAFGSFIIAVIQFIRYMMKYLEKQAAAQKNRVLVLLLKVVQCCIWCFEKCVKFLNKNAYIQTALKGTNFCTSAKVAFFLILRNIVRFGAVAMLSSLVHSIGFFSIVVGTTAIGYFLVRAMHDDINPVVPCVSFFFMSYVVAKLFMAVFGLAVDTSLQCFLACEEMGGCGDLVPKALSRFVKKNVDKEDGCE